MVASLCLLLPVNPQFAHPVLERGAGEAEQGRGAPGPGNHAAGSVQGIQDVLALQVFQSCRTACRGVRGGRCDPGRMAGKGAGM